MSRESPLTEVDLEYLLHPSGGGMARSADDHAGAASPVRPRGRAPARPLYETQVRSALWGDFPAEAQDLLIELVERLPAKYRQVIEGLFWEGLSEMQMALQIGCARSTIQRRKARALAMLRVKLTDGAASS